MKKSMLSRYANDTSPGLDKPIYSQDSRSVKAACQLQTASCPLVATASAVICAGLCCLLWARKKKTLSLHGF